MMLFRPPVIIIVTLAYHCSVKILLADGFQPRITGHRTGCCLQSPARVNVVSPRNDGDTGGPHIVFDSRRDFWSTSVIRGVAWWWMAMVTAATAAAPGAVAAAAASPSSSSSLDSLLHEIQQARQQMNTVPDLIRAEQWDSVRSVLITPPLSDLWTKSARKASLLSEYAQSVGADPVGDELAVLEAKDEVETHLRFLDMAVYNNNFNPIKSMGEIGATKELIRSYKEDPINEFKASIAALDELIQLGKLN